MQAEFQTTKTLIQFDILMASINLIITQISLKWQSKRQHWIVIGPRRHRTTHCSPLRILQSKLRKKTQVNTMLSVLTEILCLLVKPNRQISKHRRSIRFHSRKDWVRLKIFISQAQQKCYKQQRDLNKIENSRLQHLLQTTGASNDYGLILKWPCSDQKTFHSKN